jgi:hypothetical protein
MAMWMHMFQVGASSGLSFRLRRHLLFLIVELLLVWRRLRLQQQQQQQQQQLWLQQKQKKLDFLFIKIFEAKFTLNPIPRPPRPPFLPATQ